MKIIAAALAVVTLLASPALAQMRSHEAPLSDFYLYGEYDYYTDSGKERGGGVGLGWNFNRYLGLQGGAQFLNSSMTNAGNTGVNIDSDAKLFYGEAKLSWPLTDSFSVYAAAGLAYADMKATATYAGFPYNLSKTATGYRIGVGTEYWFSRHWGLRASWHQHNAGGVGSDLGAGIVFRF